MKKIVLYFALLLLSMHSLLAQQGTLLKDINVSGPDKPGSTPLGFTKIGNSSFFSADDGVHGRELWKTDGTPACTVLVSDVAGGAASSNPEQITNVNGTAFYVTGGGSQVHSIWKSGGTPETTLKVKDFTGADTLQGLIHVNGTLFFGIVNGSGSMQLWKNDGTSSGTQLIKTFPQTTTFSPVTLNGQVYFGAYDGINSIELWKSNGTAQGTVVVKDITPNRGESMYNSITVAGNFVYYILSEGFPSYTIHSLVKSDGTAQGTTVLKKFSYWNVLFSKFTVVNDLVFFISLDGAAFDDYSGEVLWRTDGTTEGTFAAAKLKAYQGDPYLYTHDLIAANGQFYFVHGFEEEIWSSDGTEAGTHRVTNIGSKPEQVNIEHLTLVGNFLYFTASNESSGREIWETDLLNQTTSLA